MRLSGLQRSVRQNLGAKWIWTADLDLDNTVILRKKVERADATRRWTTKPGLDASCAPAVR